MFSKNFKDECIYHFLVAMVVIALEWLLLLYICHDLPYFKLASLARRMLGVPVYP